MIRGKQNFRRPVLSLGFTLILLLNIAQSSGQDLASSQAWIDFNYTRFITPKLSVGGDGGYRGTVNGEQWTVFYIRPDLNYRINPIFTLNASLASFWNFSPAHRPDFEFRLVQELRVNWPSWTALSFQHRIRIDERFLWYGYSEERIDEPKKSQTARGRYQLGVRSRYFNLLGKIPNICLLSSAEFFFPFKSEPSEIFANQSRLVIGFGQLLPKNWRYDLHFMWQRSRNQFGQGFDTEEKVLRLRFFIDSKI